MKALRPLILLILLTVGCRDTGPEQFGTLGEACFADSDCRTGDLLCIDGVCGFHEPEWPLTTAPEELVDPEGLYLATSVTFTNSNAATRVLQPFLDDTLASDDARPGFILEFDTGGAPFLLYGGPVAGNSPDLDFFPPPLDVEPLTGSTIDLNNEPISFATITSRPRERPTEHFFMWLRGTDFDIPVPIAPSRTTGTIEEAQVPFTLVVDGYIFISQASQVPIEASGAENLAALLDPETGDVDFDRDGTPEGWNVQMTFRAERVAF